MLNQIQNVSACYHRLPDEMKKIAGLYTSQAAARFVFASNALDGIGIQSESQTKELIYELVKQSDGDFDSALDITATKSRQELETINTYYAMHYFSKQLEQNKKEAGLSQGNFAACLDEEEILKAHRILMVGTGPAPAGEWRNSNVMASSYVFDKVHFYRHDDSAAVGSEMTTLLDDFNGILSATPFLEQSRLTSPEAHRVALQTLFQLAAWLLFRFVDLHPFRDGNGRMSRLLANRVLGLECPFPVAPYPAESVQSKEVTVDVYQWTTGLNHFADSNWKFTLHQRCVKPSTPKDYYLLAIEKCRYGSAGFNTTLYESVLTGCDFTGRTAERFLYQHPCDLAALLIENAWSNWKRLKDFMVARGYNLAEPLYRHLGELQLHVPPSKKRENGRTVLPTIEEDIATRYRCLPHTNRSSPPNQEQLDQEISALMQLVNEHIKQYQQEQVTVPKVYSFTYWPEENVRCSTELCISDVASSMPAV